MARKKPETVMGLTIPEPRFTLGVIWLGLVWVAAPLLLITGLMDLAMQVFFGVCTGLWCFV